MERATSQRASGIGLVVLLLAGVGAASAQEASDTPTSGCERCHVGLTDAGLVQPAHGFQDDVHRDSGLTCVACHGGDPESDDKDQSKAEGTGYAGSVRGTAEVTMCARCHSDVEFMRRYAPMQRVDQAIEYASSAHGRRLAQGMTGVATCTSCHGVHPIRRAGDAQSPVYPTNVADTCATCHSNEQHMTLHGDGNLPTSQLVEFQKSVHFTALTEQNDLSAPTCNDCHGNHGAKPPEVADLSQVCGTCHAIFRTRFEVSVHAELFGCAECHGNHDVQPAADEMIGADEGSICLECHAEDTGIEVATTMRVDIENLKQRIAEADALTLDVANEGMEVSDQELMLGEARNALTLARTEIHSLDLEALAPIIEEGLTLTDRVVEDGQAQYAELRFRRGGLAVSLGAILLFAVALWLKMRELDRVRHTGSASE